MKTEIENENLRLENESGQPASRLFEDPLTEQTRSRQKILLLTSIITLLLIFSIVSPTEADIGGLKLAISKSTHLIYFFGFGTIYLTLSYLSSAYADFLKYRYEVTPAFLTLNKTASYTYHQLIMRNERISTHWKHLTEASATRQELIDEHHSLSTPYDKKLDDLFAEFNKLHQESKTESQERRDAILDQINSTSTKRNETCDPYIEIIKNFDHYDKVKTISKQMLDEANDKSELNKLKSIHRTIKRHWIVYRTRLFIEIVFPSGLAAFSIWQAFSI